LLDTTPARLDSEPTGSTPAAPPRRPTALGKVISGWEALAIAAAWILAVTGLTAISPAPTDEAQPPLVVALNLAFNLGFFGALAAAIARRRAIYVAGMVAGGAMAIMAGMCGLSGHTGLWIPAQGLVGLGFVAYGAARLRSATAPRPTG
jgi:hypothetical protein